MKKEGDFTLFFLLSHISLHDSPLTVADKHDNFIPFSGSRHFSFYSFDSIGVVKTRLIKNAVNIPISLIFSFENSRRRKPIEFTPTYESGKRPAFT